MNLQEWAALLTAAGVGGVLVEAFRALMHRRNMDADAARTVTEAALGLVTPLRERVSELEGDLASTEQHASDLDRDLKEATSMVVRLLGQIEELQTELTACRAELQAMRNDMGRPQTSD